MRCILGVATALALSACGPSDEAGRAADVGPLEGPFYVSDHFTPSGHMGDGQEPGYIFVDIARKCKERPEGAGGACYRFTYQPGPITWAGVWWVHPANNWGLRPGRDLAQQYNTIRFYAAMEPFQGPCPEGEGNGTCEIDELNADFFAGAADDVTKPYRDKFKARVEGGVTLTRDWQQFTIDLSFYEIDSVLGAFAWVIDFPDTQDWETAEPRVLYLDDIVWE